MEASSNAKEVIAMSSKGEKFSVQDDNEFTDPSSIHDLGEEFLKTFCRKAVMSFFEEYGLVSHQINSYNEFIKNGLRTAFDSFAGEGGDVQDMLPRHAKLQNMTYSSWMKVNVQLQVYTQKRVISGNFETRREQFIQKEVIIEETKDIIIGRIPLMVKSDLCWMKGAQKGDCDHVGYFCIKGAEKVRSPCRQVLKHAWAEGCIRFSRVKKVSLLQYKALLKSTCFSFKANSWSTFRGCFRKGACDGLMRYATPFATSTAGVITEQLQRAGFSKWGTERLYDGRTG